jgi:hypothetical protein
VAPAYVAGGQARAREMLSRYAGIIDVLKVHVDDAAGSGAEQVRSRRSSDCRSGLKRARAYVHIVISPM